MEQYNVGILGATGAVGQKFVRLLENHPWFTITKLGASERSAGKKYRNAVNWIEPTKIPAEIANITVSVCKAPLFADVDFIFSGLDSSVATEIEKNFASAGIPVISNAKNYRMHKQVPLLIPEVNAGHCALIKKQKFTDDGSGWIVTNPNCVAIPLVLALKPLHDALGIKAVSLTSMQAISGAGYPGVASLDILGNVIPYISGEEPKIHEEPLKLLGKLSGETIQFADFPVQSTAVRVPTINGHLLSITAELEQKPESETELAEIYRNWENPIGELNLPSSPAKTLYLHENNFHPQPRLHADRDSGMQIGIGRLRLSNIMDVSLVALGHNTIRGAAGCSILNAEYLVKKEYLGSKKLLRTDS